MTGTTTETADAPQKKRHNDKSRKDKRSRKQRKEGWLTAEHADRHLLYERAVQEPDAEVEFIDRVWRERRGRIAYRIREDFCGTAIASCAWVRHREENTAIGLDIDDEVLAWARERLNERLTDSQRARISLLKQDVMTAQPDPVDTILAMNFSYYLFKTRNLLRAYFERARAALVDDGIFILDAYGGSEAFEEMEEERDCDGFTYVWDQAVYSPVTGDAVNHIHFRFPDGTEMTEAFSYEWRLWTLPEIQELLDEAGFRRITVYWEGTDEETEEGNGEFEPTTRGEACAGWIAYIVAEK